jgi:hypothetical protein
MKYLNRLLLTAIVGGWAVLGGTQAVAQDVTPANWPGHGHKGRATVGDAPCPPAVIAPPGTTVAPPTTTPPGTTPPSTTPPTAAPFEDVLSGAAAQSQFALAERAPGYIDSAVPATQFRVRYDSLLNANRPDRAEFFYPRYFSRTTLVNTTNNVVLPGVGPGQPGVVVTTPGVAAVPNPIRGRGPGQEVDVIPRSADFQELSAYLEVAASNRLSFFSTVPYRWTDINFSPGAPVTQSFDGLGDIQAGFKYALVATDSTYVTFQLTGYIPTGSGLKGLGTEHWSIEPGLLFTSMLTDRLTGYAEVKDWIACGGEPNFAGNILRYGVGASYLCYDSGCVRVAPVVELVAWTVLDGSETRFEGAGSVVDAHGTTIVNAKYGVRIGFGEVGNQPGNLGGSDVYVGFGHALTGNRWYQDVFRVEYRIRF